MITINIARISPDRKKLEINIETLSNYTFENMYIWEYNDSSKLIVTQSTKNLSSNFNKEDNTEILSIDLEENGLQGNTMYYIQLEVLWDETGEEYPSDFTSDDKHKIIVILDLTQLYFSKVKLFRNIDKCFDIRSKIVELSLYETNLKSALLLERWDDADYWFNIITKELKSPILV